MKFENHEHQIILKTTFLQIKMSFLHMFQKMVVERITQHLLQGKMFLQIQVSMPPDILIR